MAEWGELLAEHRQQVVGPKIQAEVRRVASRISQRYDPSIYASSGGWGDAIDDLVNDVIETLLANDREQLKYVMDVAQSISDFRGLVGKHVGRVLSHSRKRTLVDNLLDRSRKMLRGEPFMQIGRLDGRPAYALREDRVLASPTRANLREAALLIAKVPKKHPPAGDRAWMVWDTPSLELVLQTIARALPTAFTERDVGAVFEEVLAGSVPTFLEDDVNAEDMADYRWSNADVSEAADAAARALKTMDSEQRRALALRQAGRKHEEIAAALGCSRPTAAARIDHGIAYLRAQLEDLSPSVQRLAVDIVLLGLDRDLVQEEKPA